MFAYLFILYCPVNNPHFEQWAVSSFLAGSAGKPDEWCLACLLLCWSAFCLASEGKNYIIIGRNEDVALHLLDDEHLFQICFIKYFVLEELW